MKWQRIAVTAHAWRALLRRNLLAVVTTALAAVSTGSAIASYIHTQRLLTLATEYGLRAQRCEHDRKTSAERLNALQRFMPREPAP
jgi:hypothetical protein